MFVPPFRPARTARKRGDCLLCPKAATPFFESMRQVGAGWTERAVPMFSPRPQSPSSYPGALRLHPERTAP